MESILSFCVALEYVKDVRTEFSVAAYDKFIETLKDFRRGKITSSTAFSTVQTLLQNHPNLLDACNTYKPRAAVEERSDVTSSVDFINRVKLRFRDGEVYSEFLNSMRAYSRRQMTASEACDKVVELFGGNDDLIVEVRGFLHGSKKRKVVDQNQNQNQTDSDGETQRSRKKMDNDMEEEDSLCEIDVKISNLKSCRESAENLTRLLSEGSVTAEGFVVAEHFTALNVACMRRADRKIVEHLQRDVVNALPHLIQILSKNKDSLEKQRLKIAQSWSKLRYTNIIH